MRRHMLAFSLTTLPLALALASGCRTEQAPPDPQPSRTATASAEPGTEGMVAPEGAATTGTATDPTPLTPSPMDSAATQQQPPLAGSPTMGAARQAPAQPMGATPQASPANSPATSAGLPPAPAPAPAPIVERSLEIPAGTSLPLELTTAVASDTSAVEDPVTARVVRDVVAGGETVVPAGSTVAGRVTYAQQSGQVRGVAGLTVRFYTLTIGSRTHDISAEPIRRQAATTRGKDAQKIGIGAGAGAVVGGLLGGRRGAAIGAAAGGAGGTGVVLATRGDEVSLPSGTTLDLRLTDGLVVPVR